MKTTNIGRPLDLHMRLRTRKETRLRMQEELETNAKRYCGPRMTTLSRLIRHWGL